MDKGSSFTNPTENIPLNNLPENSILDIYMNSEHSSSSRNNPQTHFVPQLNVLQGAAIIAGAMIGTGVYATPSQVVAGLNATGTALLIWVGCGLASFFGAMSYAEWGSRVTVSGGDAPFLDYVYKKPKHFIAIVYTWVRVILINPGYTASPAFLIGYNFSNVFPILAPPGSSWEIWTPKLFGVIFLILETMLCIPSNKLAGNFNLVITMFSVLCLCCIIFIGFFLLINVLPNASLENFSSEVLFKPTTSNPSKWALAIYRAMWAYDGWFNLASCLGELKNPNKNIFRSTLIGLSVTSILFFFVNVSFLLRVPYNDFINAELSLPMVWGELLFGNTGKYMVTCFYCTSLAACCFNTIFSSSRIAQAAGEAKLLVFHSYIAQLSPKFGTPINALLINLIFSIIILLAVPGLDAFDYIMIIVSYPVWLFITLTLIGLIYIKYKERAMWKKPEYLKIPVWVNVLYPFIVVLLGIFLLIFPFFEEESAQASGLGLAVVLTGLIPYYFLIHRNKKQ